MAFYDIGHRDEDFERKARIEDEMMRQDQYRPPTRNGQFLAGMSRMAGDENHPLAAQVLNMVSKDPMPMSNPQFKQHRKIHGY